MKSDLTDEQIELLSKTWDDLHIQAMIFDMDIDWETLSLTMKRKDTTPQWIKIYKDRERDNLPGSPEQAWA